MRLNLGVWAIALLTIFLPVALGQDNLTLDLSAPDVMKELEAMSGVCSGARFGAVAVNHPETFKRPTLPLKLEILNLNGNDFKVGDFITTELRLTNVGKKDVMLPWDIHAGTVYGPSPGCAWPKTHGATGLRGTLYVELVDAGGKTAINAATDLYAISTAPNSYRNLAPGRNARITISGRIHVPPLPANRPLGITRPESSEIVSVTAVFKLDNSSYSKPFEKLVSANQVSITVANPDTIAPQK